MDENQEHEVAGEQTLRKKTRRNQLDMAASSVITATVFLLPFFFLPSGIFPFQSTKGVFLSLGVALALVLWIVARLKDNTLEMPKTFLFGASFGLVLVYFISSLFSHSVSGSLLGRGSEIDTFTSILILVFLFALIPLVFKSKQRIGRLYGLFFISIIIVSVFQLLRIIGGPGLLSMGVFTNPISNLVGSWNDLGVFFGLVSIITLSAIEFLPAKKPLKMALYALLVVALFFLALVNFTPTWIVVGLLGLLFFVYTLSFGSLFGADADRHEQNNEYAEYQSQSDEEKENGFAGVSVTSLVVFVVALVFILSGGSLGDGIANSFGIAQLEARPSWRSTLEIGGQTVKSAPLFGAGPNQFVKQWLLMKPDGVNASVFWNIDFTNGIAAIPSTLTTVGIVGFLAWLLFIGMYIAFGFKGIIRSLSDDPFTRYLSISSFLASLYLWIFTFLYVPNIVVLALAFAFSGIFVAVQYQSGHMRGMRFSFVKNPKAGFVSVLVIVLLLIGGVSGMYVIAQRYISGVTFQRGLIAANVRGDVDTSEELVVRAINLHESDQYYRTLSQINLVRLNQIVNQPTASDDLARAQFQTVLGAAIDNARRATLIDQSNYQNWLSLGQIYEAIVPLGVAGAYDSSKEAYDEALALNPSSPAIYLTQARLAISNNDLTTAREMIAAAINLKGNYTEAVFLLSQIETVEGNIGNAIQAVEAASALSPNDPTIFFQLGLLRYNQSDFEGAAGALERAVSLRPDYANAKYFLGLSYDQLGRVEDAIAQFEDIETLNPDNQEVKTILGNLRGGLSALGEVSAPENRDSLPFSEETFEDSDEIEINEAASLEDDSDAEATDEAESEVSEEVDEIDG